MGADRGLSAYEGRTVIAGLRPSDFEDADVWHREGLAVMEVVPDVTEELGSEMHVIFSIDAPPVVTDHTAAAQSEEGAEEALAPLGDGRATFTARVDAQSKARPRQPIRLTIDPARMHFFDPSTGQAIAARRPASATAQP